MLSLFGYDFDADHQALMKDGSGRVDIKNVAESLILSKPTDADNHEGGKRFDKNGWEYQVFRRWIEDGAEKRSKNQSSDQKLVKLEVSPLEISFDAAGRRKSLRRLPFGKWYQRRCNQRFADSLAMMRLSRTLMKRGRYKRRTR